MTTLHRWVIGRAPDCDVIVNVPEVSARHCSLTETDQGFFIEDLQSSNGTFVNGERITGKKHIKPRDRVTLGQKIIMPWPSPREVKKSFVMIGRDPENDVVLDYPMISAHHARIVIEDDKARIEDLESTNGTAIGHPDNRITQSPLDPADVVFFGSFHVSAARLLEGRLTLGEEPHRNVTLAGQSMTFGRDPTCDQALNYPMISWRHARLARLRGKLIVQDLGSTNGTFLNGKRVRRTAEVKAGDVIGLGSYTFTLTDVGKCTLEKRNYRGNVTLEARGVNVDIHRKRLIEGASLTIFPSEFVGVMGHSGSGKTTLMNALNGYLKPSAGEVLLNGRDLYAHYAQFCTYVGYVPQDDIIHRDLTVGQALYYTARLRLPSDYTKSDIRARIREVIRQLGLEGTENIRIGSPEKRGISGGQRKRVNLAMELLTDPLVLFLDEPTSGLSSEDAVVVMKMLRKLADAGKTIFLTIHQPSLEVFRMLDNLVLIARNEKPPGPGRIAYYGPAYPDAVKFFNPDGVPNAQPSVDPSPDEILRGLSERRATEWVERYEGSAQHREYVQNRAGKKVRGKMPVRASAQLRWSDYLLQWWTLLSRCISIKLKDHWHTAVLMAQAPIIACLVVLIFRKTLIDEVTDLRYYSQKLGASLFLTSLSAIWFGCSNSLREIIGEWAIYRRERMVNLKIWPYVAAKFTVLGLLCIIQCAVMLGIVHWGLELHGPWLPMLGILLIAALVGVGLGLMISAVSRSSEMAIALVPIIMLIMIAFGGTILPVHDFPDAGLQITYCMPSRWAFEGLLVLESGSRVQYKVLPSGPVPLPPINVPPTSTTDNEESVEYKDLADFHFPERKPKTEKGVLINWEDHRHPPVVSGTILESMFILLVAAVAGILRLRDLH